MNGALLFIISGTIQIKKESKNLIAMEIASHIKKLFVL